MASLTHLVATRGLFQSKVPYGNYEPMEEVRLWRAVLDRALLDLLKGYEVGVENYESALHWYSKDETGDFDETFYVVCHMAGLEPDFVSTIFSRALKYQGGSLEGEEQ